MEIESLSEEIVRVHVQTLHGSVATLERLLSATTGHRGVPAETRVCLEQMAVCVQRLSDACGVRQPTNRSGRSRTRHDTIIDIAAVGRRESELRALVGDVLITGLEQETASRSCAGPAPAGAGLTPRERRILELIAEGCTNRQIAGELYLAEKTVKNYVSNLLRKLGMQRRTQAAVYAASLERIDRIDVAASEGSA